MAPTPLAVTYRGGRIDGIHRGSIAVTDRTGQILFSVNDPHYPTYFRSSSKMFQAIPVVRSGAADRFGFTQAELAICCASHSAAQYHLDAVASMLGKIGLDESALACGAHDPHDRAVLEHLLCSHLPPSTLHNNCSGKHAGMLATCLAMGWPIENYLALEHPLQQWIHDLIAEFSGIPRELIGTAIDGCSLPTFFLPIDAMSTALARFIGSAKEGDEAADRILAALAANPEMIYERGGFDSELIRVLGGRCIAKRGAMAVFVVGIDTEKHGPIGVTAKLEDGNITPMSVVIMHVLELIGAITPEEAEALREFRAITIRNWRGMEVGEMAAAFEMQAHSHTHTAL